MRYFPVSTPRPSGEYGRMPSPSSMRGGHHLVLDAAVEQRVLHLRRDQGRPAGHGALPGRALRGAPAGPVRDADVRRPPGAHRGVERRERLLDRGRVGPDVHLPEVDVVDAEPAQGEVEAAEQVAARGVHHPGAAAGAEPGLGRDHHVVAGDHVTEQPAEQLLRRAAAVRVRGVEQRAARVDEGGELLAGLVLVGLRCPRSSAPGRVARPRGRSDPGTCAAWAKP